MQVISSKKWVTTCLREQKLVVFRMHRIRSCTNRCWWGSSFQEVLVWWIGELIHQMFDELSCTELRKSFQINTLRAPKQCFTVSNFFKGFHFYNECCIDMASIRMICRLGRRWGPNSSARRRSKRTGSSLARLGRLRAQSRTVAAQRLLPGQWAMEW